MSSEKFVQSVDDLKAALKYKDKALKERFYYAGVSKSFEVALEYAWKYLRGVVIDSGLEAPSPRDAIKQAGKIGIITNVELWLEFLRVRNLAVHDYLGVTPEQYLKTIQEFAGEVVKLTQKTA